MCVFNATHQKPGRAAGASDLSYRGECAMQRSKQRKERGGDQPEGAYRRIRGVVKSRTPRHTTIRAEPRRRLLLFLSIQDIQL